MESSPSMDSSQGLQSVQPIFCSSWGVRQLGMQQAIWYRPTQLLRLFGALPSSASIARLPSRHMSVWCLCMRCTLLQLSSWPHQHRNGQQNDISKHDMAARRYNNPEGSVYIRMADLFTSRSLKNIRKAKVKRGVFGCNMKLLAQGTAVLVNTARRLFAMFGHKHIRHDKMWKLLKEDLPEFNAWCPDRLDECQDINDRCMQALGCHQQR